MFVNILLNSVCKEELEEVKLLPEAGRLLINHQSAYTDGYVNCPEGKSVLINGWKYNRYYCTWNSLTLEGKYFPPLQSCTGDEI